MVEKFCKKDAKKGNFSKQMEFRKKSNILYLGLDPSRYEHDGTLLHIPIIKTVPRPFSEEIQNIFDRLSDFTHVLFTSRSAIPIFLEYTLKAKKLDFAKQQTYLCIGKATAQLLEQNGLVASHIASEETAEGMVALLDTLAAKIGKLFFPRSAQGRNLLPEFLRNKGVPFTVLDLYETQANTIELPDLESFDEIIFTSPSTVKAFFNIAAAPLNKCKPIGPITKKCLEDYFFS